MFLLQIVCAVLDDYLIRGWVTPKGGQRLRAAHNAVVASLSAKAMPLIEGLGVKPWMIFAPIAGDWVEYNVRDNQGSCIRSNR